MGAAEGGGLIAPGGGRLISPEVAVSDVVRRLETSWVTAVARAVSGEESLRIEVRLRPGVSASAAVARLGYDAWFEWRRQWADVTRSTRVGVKVSMGDIVVNGVAVSAPVLLHVADVEVAGRFVAEFGHAGLKARIDRAIILARRFVEVGQPLDAGTLRDLCRRSASDADALLETVRWLTDNPDIGRWTLRQLPIPGVHTKWLAANESLVRRVTGRAVVDEVRRKPAIVHVTYVDPDYRETGARWHDSWTAGDSYILLYQPRVVVIVENRDCRLSFPEVPGGVVVEGAGAAAASLAEVPWLVGAKRVFYWGDLDADGFGILSLVRRSMRERGVSVESLLMGVADWERYQHLGVATGKRSEPLGPTNRRLSDLTSDELACYARLASAGSVAVRRIEQERIPQMDVDGAVRDLLARSEAPLHDT